MRKYLAAVFGIAVGVAAAVLVAARADDNAQPGAGPVTGRQDGGA